MSKNVQRSSPVIRFFKWVGLISGITSMLYIHYTFVKPENFRISHSLRRHILDREVTPKEFNELEQNAIRDKYKSSDQI